MKRISLTHRFTKMDTNYSFYYNGVYASKIIGVQCEHMVKRGNVEHQCMRKSSLTLPYCTQHLNNVYHLIVKRTNLKDQHGERMEFKGLFTYDKKKGLDDIVFHAQQPIIPCIGEVITTKTLNKRYPDDQTAPYGIGLHREKCIDSAYMRGVGAVANTCRPDQKRCLMNAMFYQSDPVEYYPDLIAIDGIKNHTEILVDYGEEYWGREHRPHETLLNR